MKVQVLGVWFEIQDADRIHRKRDIVVRLSPKGTTQWNVYVEDRDGNILDRYEFGKSASHFADLDFSVDDTELCIYLRRNTKKRKDFTIFIPIHAARELYEMLQDKFGDT